MNDYSVLMAHTSTQSDSTGELSLQSFPSSGLPRKYRSKRQRPCDLCRHRKTQCKILKVNSGCELCIKLKRQCTFVLKPARRSRPATTSQDNIGQGVISTPATTAPDERSTTVGTLFSGTHLSDIDFDIDELLPELGADQILPSVVDFGIQQPITEPRRGNTLYNGTHLVRL